MNHKPCKIKQIDFWLYDDYEGKNIRYNGYLIEEKHSYEDIARLIIDNGWEDDLMALLSNAEFVAAAKRKV